MTLALCLGLLVSGLHGSPSTGPQTDPAFQLATKLVGGKWEGVVGKKVKIEFRFHLEEGGNKMVGIGTLDVGSSRPVSVHNSLGWDAGVKQVYYLDEHGFNTVYFGHVTREGDDLIFDFNALSGDSGHYRSREHISKGAYQATMEVEKDGKWQDLGMHITMKKVK